MTAESVQLQRLLVRSGFFALFVLAPPLDILRLDLDLGHFILFGLNWTLGIDGFVAGTASPGEAALNLILRGFLPIALVVGGILYTSWRWGRLYCGWLCPHFSVVEAINALMRRASGKPSLWERRPLPDELPDGGMIRRSLLWWIPTLLAIFGFSFLWAVAFLTYLVSPTEIYGNLWNGTLTRNQAFFIGAATLALMVEFTLARHLFCRFACAVGLFQSLAWMANKRAMVVGFDRDRAHACDDCNLACENACPMRLKPRTIKRRMFTCTQCGQCLEACEQVRRPAADAPVIQWVEGKCALSVSDLDFGRRPEWHGECFDRTRPTGPARRPSHRPVTET